MLDPLDIDGEKPKLKNATLEELFCHELWYNGELYEPANVIYLKINSKWLFSILTTLLNTEHNKRFSMGVP